MLGENNYTLDIRPTFIDELDATVRYIEQELCNPLAADKLIEQTYAAIDERLFAPGIVCALLSSSRCKATVLQNSSRKL